METASDGVQALSKLKAGSKPDLIITDINMPNMGGLELSKRPSDIRFSITPILTLTTESQTAKRDEAKKLGATGWLVKPVDRADRIKVIRISESYDPGAVAVIGDSIAAVGLEADIKKEYNGKETIDCGSKVLMPGLINAHTHVPMTLLRGLADDLRLDVWLMGYMMPVEREYVSPEFVRLGTSIGCAELIRERCNRKSLWLSAFSIGGGVKRSRADNAFSGWASC